MADCGVLIELMISEVMSSGTTVRFGDRRSGSCVYFESADTFLVNWRYLETPTR